MLKASARHMNAGERRPLSAGEVALAQSVFGDEVDWGRVRIVQLNRFWGFAAMVPFGGAILFSKWRAWRDFSRAPASEQGWLVHELAHVWQAQRGVVLAAAKLSAIGRRSYKYRVRRGAKLKHYNIERQAEIARHLFMARQGRPDERAPAREWLEAVWAQR